MKPEENPRPVTEISDFREILRSSDGEVLPVVVGGHAVNFWSLYFLEAGVAELADYLPFTSKDLDIVATMNFLYGIHKRFRGELICSPPRSPVLGRLEIPDKKRGLLKIEVLHTVGGLNPGELVRTIELKTADLSARVLLPHLVLKAKISNSVRIDQTDRADVKHVRMMILCVRAFVKELLGNVAPGRISQRAMVNTLGELWDIVTHADAVKASDKWGFDFEEVWPMDELNTCGLEKIQRFMKHRFGG